MPLLPPSVKSCAPRHIVTASLCEQLNAADRVIDMGGAPLTLEFLHESLYHVWRNRGADGSSHPVIDAFMDDGTWHRWMLAEKNRFSRRFEFTIKEVESKFLSGRSFEHAIVDVPECNYRLAGFTDWGDEYTLPKKTIAVIGLYDVSLSGKADHPERHLWIKNFSSIAS